MKAIQVMIVDDQQLVRMGLSRMLGDVPDIIVTGSSGSGEEVMEYLETLVDPALMPDVVLMDLRMPGIGGLEATRRLLRQYPQIRIVAVTGCDEQPFPQRFLEMGASAFITKDAGLEEVVRAIRLAFQGKRYISQQTAQELALTSVRPAPEAAGASPFGRLSDRELQVALMILEGIKTSEMAEKLALSPKSVNTYRYRMFEKLCISSNMELAMLAARHGLLENHGQPN